MAEILIVQENPAVEAGFLDLKKSKTNYLFLLTQPSA
jgi:hypothetical protein